jgi:hypothetical protein
VKEKFDFVADVEWNEVGHASLCSVASREGLAQVDTVLLRNVELRCDSLCVLRGIKGLRAHAFVRSTTKVCDTTTGTCVCAEHQVDAPSLWLESELRAKMV